jgi:hypothetical protein
MAGPSNPLSPTPSIANLAEAAASAPLAIPTVIETKEGLRIPPPDKYDGNPATLEQFIMKSLLYMGFHGDKFKHDTEKALFMITRFEGRAYDWIEPHMSDYWPNQAAGGKVSTAMTLTTRDYLRNTEGLIKGMRQAFGDIDLKKKSELALQRLKQTGSAARYHAEFQQQSARLGFNDVALRAQFYKGLKEHVKDELARTEPADTLQELVESAIKIDNRAYERKLEKKGSYSHHMRPAKNRHNDPMDLDATQRRELKAVQKQTYKGQSGKLSATDKKYRRENRLCFQCGKPGHIASFHHGKGTKQLKAMEVKNISATRRVELDTNDSSGDEIRQAVRQIHGVIQELDEMTSEVSGISKRLDQAVSRSRDTSPEPVSTLSRNIHNEEDGNSSDSSESSSGPGKPRVGEIWIYEGIQTTGQLAERTWRKSRTEELFHSPEKLSAGTNPVVGTTWVVMYEDANRTVFRVRTGRDYLVERSQEEEEFENFQDIVRIGTVWELSAASDYCRVWKKTMSKPWQRTQHCLEIPETLFAEKLELHTPYGIERIYPHGRMLKNLFTWEQVWDPVRTPGVPGPLEAAATGGTGQIEIRATLRGKPLRVMVDSGAMGNFISPRTVAKINAPIKSITPYELQVVDGTKVLYNDGVIDQGIVHSRLVVEGGHTESLSFDIAPIGRHDAILGMPWIKKHNPDIDWSAETLTFSRCQCEGSH